MATKTASAPRLDPTGVSRSVIQRSSCPTFVKYADGANTILLLHLHATNLCRARDSRAAAEFLTVLRDKPLVQHDYTWQRAQLALACMDASELVNLIDARLEVGDLGIAWRSALFGALAHHVLSDQQIEYLHRRWGGKIAKEDEGERYLKFIEQHGLSVSEV